LALKALITQFLNASQHCKNALLMQPELLYNLYTGSQHGFLYPIHMLPACRCCLAPADPCENWGQRGKHMGRKAARPRGIPRRSALCVCAIACLASQYLPQHAAKAIYVHCCCACTGQDRVCLLEASGARYPSVASHGRPFTHRLLYYTRNTSPGKPLEQ
jgi:hypothetical protein